MFVYVSMMLWTALCGFLSKDTQTDYLIEGKIEKRIHPFFAVLIMGYIAIFMGTFFGHFDLPTYESGFNGLPYEPSEIPSYMETVTKYPGFHGLQILFKCFISTEFLHFNLMLVIFDCIAILYLFRKYSCNFAFSVFLFLAAAKHTWMVNGIKQFFANCIILLGCKFLMEKKFFKFAAFVIVASFFHTSALIVLPIYFFVHGKPWNKKMLLILAASLLAVVFLSSFTNILDFILEATDYGTSVLEDNSGSNILRVPIAAVPAVIALISRKKIEKIAPKYINICINMSLISACLYFISSFTSGIHMGRLPIYFDLYSFISLPWLIDNAFDNKTNKFVKTSCIACYLLMYFVLDWKTPYYSKVLDIYITP